jgi:hypothetical protein
MGKIIDKDTKTVLAQFDDELEGEMLKAKYKKEGRNIKVEW